MSKCQTRETDKLTFSNVVAAYLRNVWTSAQGTEKEITTRESRRKARQEQAKPLAQGDGVCLLPLCGPSTCTSFKTFGPVLYCESILQWRHNCFLSHLTDKTGISHSYQNKRESNQSDRVYLSSGSIHCLDPSQSTTTTVSPPLGYQMCMAQFGMRHTQINILPQGRTGETSCRVSKENILGFICVAVVSWLPWCCCIFWRWTLIPVSIPDLKYHGEDSQSVEGLSSGFWVLYYKTGHALFVLNRWPLNIQSSLSASPYPAFILKCSNPHSDNMSRSCYSILPSSPVYIRRSFCFSLFCTHTYARPGSHTFFISLSHLYFWALWWNQPFFPRKLFEKTVFPSIAPLIIDYSIQNIYIQPK